jgi:hypothetical integral membrane protein (TIGR02206 family)
VSDLVTGEHLGALAGIAVSVAVLVVAARTRPGAWLKTLAVVLVVDELSWWVFLASGGSPAQASQPLPLQICDVAIFLAAAALWTRNQLLVELTYFWGLAGTLQAILTPDLPQHFPSYPYFQYYIAHGGVVAAALILVVGLRIPPRPWAVARAAGIAVAYAAFVGLVDAVTGADYMYLSSKPASSTLLDLMGPWPWYVLWAGLFGVLLFAVLDAPFRLRERRAEALP